MAYLPIRLVCNECYEGLEWECSEGVSEDTIYVEPCKACKEAAQKSFQSKESACSAKYHLALAEKGDTRCGVCGLRL
jgi:hypothetical protein